MLKPDFSWAYTVFIANEISFKMVTLLSIRYSTIETKEAARIGYSGFLFSHEYSDKGRGA